MSPEGQPDRERGASSAADGSSVSDEQWAELVRQAESGRVRGPEGTLGPGSDGHRQAARAGRGGRRGSGRRAALGQEGREAWSRGSRTAGAPGPPGRTKSRLRRGAAPVRGGPGLHRSVAGAPGGRHAAEPADGPPARRADHPGHGTPAPARRRRRPPRPAEGPSPDRPTREEPVPRALPHCVGRTARPGSRSPAAKASGGMSEDEVAHALEQTRQLLVEANLDPADTAGREAPRGAGTAGSACRQGQRERLETVDRPSRTRRTTR